MIRNKRGQTLIVFIILIPLILGFCALVVDTGLVIAKKHELKETVKTVLMDTIKEDGIDVTLTKKLLNKNKIDDENLEIKEEDEKLRVKKTTEIESIFGKIIGIKKYKIKIDLVGYWDKRLVIE